MHQRDSSKWLDALNSCSCECISQSVTGTGKEMKDKSKQSGFFFFWEHTAPSSVSVLTFQSIKCFFFSFLLVHLFIYLWGVGVGGGYLPLLLLQVCLQRWLCQGAPWCPSVCTDRSGCQPVSMERQFHIQLIQSQTFKAQSVAGCKL